MKHIPLGVPTNGVIYFLWGTGHAPLLAVSLCSLRKHYSGNICLLTPEPKGKIAEFIGESNLNVCVRQINLVQGRRNTANCTKASVHRWTPFDCSLFIDADTIVTGNVAEAFPTRKQELSVTKFSNWTVCGSAYQKRIERFRPFCPDLVDKCLKGNGPAINTGVFGFWRDAQALEPVFELTVKARSVFIPDEISMQLLYQDYPHVLLGEKFNLSVKFGSQQYDKRIVHAHGSKIHYPTIKQDWLKLFAEVWRGNVGGIRSWMPIGWPESTAIGPEIRELIK